MKKFFIKRSNLDVKPLFRSDSNILQFTNEFVKKKLPEELNINQFIKLKASMIMMYCRLCTSHFKQSKKNVQVEKGSLGKGANIGVYKRFFWFFYYVLLYVACQQQQEKKKAPRTGA